ncbi:DUF871 domain-containing protein [Haloimpatiens massiliensis]|uniref:DUF871 domain-containing protein n=1 Tax=Haloimpatiens massiliensis TaxID=1658110 RepID=UPI000C81F5EA|nr:MupG family TIM beta-alpha barrel fold protein [Haloimpatiens massiliensis]
MAKGISVFVGMDYSLEENLNYIKYAHSKGVTRIFTSLHIPEADYKKAVEEFIKITKLADSLGMKIIADISPRAFSYLGADINNLKALSDLGIYGIRVDFGFTPEEIASFTRNPYGLKVEINASTVTERFLQEFEKFNPNFQSMMACHNYYPRLNTGISLKTFQNKNNLLKKYNVEVSAFIPSLVNKRGPIYEGLPTLEIHRFMSPKTSAKHLFALGVDTVIFGDSIPSMEEIDSLGCLNEKIIELEIETYTDNEIERNIIFNVCHENRSDCAEDVIRSTSSRTTLNENDVILPHNNVERKRGFITIDNKEYLRYSGELQLCKKDLSADKRVNVVGKVVKEEEFLLDYIEEETKYCFREKRQ